MLRLGIDVGGTHTDAVLMEGSHVRASHKALTSADVFTGVMDAIEAVLSGPGASGRVAAVMLGTTQFTNAVIERRELAEVAAIRIGLPTGRGLPPKTGWPADISRALGDSVYMLHGGRLYDGQPVAELDDREVRHLLGDLVAKNVSAVSICSTYSPMDPSPERTLAEQVANALPHARITCSSSIGGLGLLERENAALLNTSLLSFAERVVGAFTSAITHRGLDCPLFISQNDGTLMDAAFAQAFPALTFASGPTNSLRGASVLSGLRDAIVVDIGGTTSDIGVLQDGFPRASNRAIEVGGVRTNFRMPDILAVGLGGGSLVGDGGRRVGPQSVGHRLIEDALVFGGSTVTATDVAVAAGRAQVGDSDRALGLDAEFVARAAQTMDDMLAHGIEQMKTSDELVPVVLVGGGEILIDDAPRGASQLVRPEHAGVANAIGASIGQIGGECERIVAYGKQPREDAIANVTQVATRNAIEAGAEPATIKVVDLEETPMSYTDEPTSRLRIKVVGDVAGLGS